MKDYFIRRLLLIPVTMLGVTLLVFLITRAAPGGPMEQAMMAAQVATEGGGSGSKQQQGGLDEEAIEANEEEFGYDKPVFVAYLQWLGMWPRERLVSKGEFFERGEDNLAGALLKDSENETLLVLKGVGREVFVRKEGDKIVAAHYTNGGTLGEKVSGWEMRIDTVEDRKQRWARREGSRKKEDAPSYPPRAVFYQARFSGLLQGDLGQSKSFGDPVCCLLYTSPSPRD